jgi:long-chain acyl-CoA synthetase
MANSGSLRVGFLLLFLPICIFRLISPYSYGMTENCATCTRSWYDDPTASGTVGPPLPVNEVKVIDVPAMGYTSEDKPNPRGELCVRGANCFTTYYKGLEPLKYWKITR